MKTGLRFDKVALGLIERIQRSLDEFIPDEMTLVFTVTAPIVLASKTAAAIENDARSALVRSSRVDIKNTIHQNSVRIVLVQGRAARSVLGFVHNPDTSAELIVQVAQSALAPS